MCKPILNIASVTLLIFLKLLCLNPPEGDRESWNVLIEQIALLTLFCRGGQTQGPHPIFVKRWVTMIMTNKAL